jgi:hypothetical protein
MWFQQKRMEGMPLSGAMLCEKATWFSQRLRGEEIKFFCQFRVVVAVLQEAWNQTPVNAR